MIHFIYDPQGFSDPSSRWVRSAQDYPTAYAECLKALRSGEDQTFVLTENYLRVWFKNMGVRYSSSQISFTNMNARQALSDKWGVEIPDHVSDQDILNAELLTIPNPVGNTFSEKVLAARLSAHIQGERLPFAQLASMIGSIPKEKWLVVQRSPFLLRILEEVLNTWKRNAESVEEKWVIDKLREDPFEFLKLLHKFKLARHYPSILANIFSSEERQLSALKLSLVSIEVDEKKYPEVTNQIIYLLNDLPATDSEGMIELIHTVSGELRCEFDEIAARSTANPELLTHEMIETLRRKFSGSGRSIDERMNKLEKLIPPPKPQKPDQAWNAEEMLSWATTEYLPYQDWCASNGKFDKDLYKVGDKFSEWLYSNWADLRSNSGKMIFNILPELSAEFGANDSVHIILVVDNLSWMLAKTFTEVMAEKKYFLRSVKPYFAMLPTETEISKKCLLSGSSGYTLLEQNNYTDILEKGWLPYTNGSVKFRYLSDIGKLRDINSIESKAYVVNYLAVDRALHKSENEIGYPHREHVKNLLDRLIDALDEFIDRLDLTERAIIHVVSDHGATQIPASEKNEVDLDFVASGGFSARSHRFMSVSTEKFASIGDNHKANMFFLPAADFWLPQNMVCARGSNRFLNVDKDVFVHGGLLPEEVVIPCLRFEPIIGAVQDLECNLSRTELHYRLENLDIMIGDPNLETAEDVRILVLNGNVEGEFESIPEIPGQSQRISHGRIRFKQTSNTEDQKYLRVRLEYTIRGERLTSDVIFKITMKKLYDQAGDDLFNF